jgi:PEGA domain-containing protein
MRSHMRLAVIPLLMVLVVGAGIGCATIMHGTNQGIGIGSSPTGANVFVDKQPQGTTPVVAKLSRKDIHYVRLELAGYQPYETALSRRVSGWVWGNIVFGGLVGLAVDAISGGLYKLTPEQLAAELKKEGQSYLLEKDQVWITVVLKPDVAWQKIDSLKPVSSER